MSLITRIFKASKHIDLDMVKDLITSSIESIFNCRVDCFVQDMEYASNKLNKVCFNTSDSIVVGDNHYAIGVDLSISGVDTTMAYLIIHVYLHSGKALDVRMANFYTIYDGTAWQDVICAINDIYIKLEGDVKSNE